MNYNAGRYNAQRYNINGVVYNQAWTETTTATETFADLAGKVLSDSSAATELFALTGMPFYLDILLIGDLIRIDFLNKALADTVRIGDWLSIRRNLAVNEWYN